MKIAIHHGGEHGFVQYDSMNKEVMVTHSNDAVSNTVRHYLSQTRRMTVPASNDPNKIGDRELIDIQPLDSVSNLEMALCEMYHATGVHVSWGHADNEGGSTMKVPNGGNGIAKSLFGNDLFDIIN